MVREFAELRDDACESFHPHSLILIPNRHRDLQEEMAAASLDVNFKEELSAIEQCELMHSVNWETSL